MSYAANEKAETKHLQGPTVYYTVAAEVVSTIHLTMLYLDKVLSDLPLLMGPKQFEYQMKLTQTKCSAKKIGFKGQLRGYFNFCSLPVCAVECLLILFMVWLYFLFICCLLDIVYINVISASILYGGNTQMYLLATTLFIISRKLALSWIVLMTVDFSDFPSITVNTNKTEILIIAPT